MNFYEKQTPVIVCVICIRLPVLTTTMTEDTILSALMKRQQESL